MVHPAAAEVLAFWFGDEADDTALAAGRKSLWWQKDPDTDRLIRARFQALVLDAAAGVHDDWGDTAEGLLALIILLDQFPRNIFRGQARSFDFDPRARHWCRLSLNSHRDIELRPVQRVFLYLPLEHSESLADQDDALHCYQRLLADVPAGWRLTFQVFLDFAQRHRDIIARFGRFPHRNALLGRASTAEERAFLETPGSSF